MHGAVVVNPIPIYGPAYGYAAPRKNKRALPPLRVASVFRDRRRPPLSPLPALLSAA